MRDHEEIRKAFELCKPQKIMRMCGFCPYNDEQNCDVVLYNDALSLLKEQEAEIKHLMLAVRVSELMRKGGEADA